MYLLAAAILLVPCGRIADIYGRKRIFLYGMMIDAAASILCAAGCRVLAVARPSGHAIIDLLAAIPGVAITRCPDADSGLGRSLAWGVAQSGDELPAFEQLADRTDITRYRDKLAPSKSVGRLRSD